MKTVTQAASELGVSRTKIYNEIEKLNINTKKVGKNNYIEDTDFEKIKEVVQSEMIDVEETFETHETAQERLKDVLERDRNILYGNISDREYTDLKERITFLEEQIKVKDEQINAKDYQINGLIQSNFNFSKALASPVTEEAVTMEEPKKLSWIKKIFKKSN